MSSRPLLGGNSNDDFNGNERTGISHLLGSWGNMFQITSQKNSIPYEAIRLMLSTEDKSDRDEITRNWRDHKIEELSFVGTVGALLAGCLASSSAWPNILPNDAVKPWGVRASWQSGLVFALFAVIIACQQSMRLHRFSSHPEGLKYIRASLVGRSGNGSKEPSHLQVYAWEASVFFLSCSIICALMGLTVLVWLAAMYDEDDPRSSLKDDNLKIAVSFTTTLGVSLIIFLGSQTAMTSLSREQ